MKTWSKFISIVLAVAIMIGAIAIPELPAEAGTVDDPTPLALDDQWTPGEIINAGDVQFYKLTLSKSGWLTIGYQGHSVRDCHYALLNGDMTKTYFSHEIYYSSDTDPKTHSHELALEPGSYIVKIDADGSNVGEYRIKASFKAANNNEKTNNNEFATSEKLSLNQDVTGFLSSDDRIDFYKIQLTKKDRILLTFTSWIRDYHIYIYDQNFNVIFQREVYYASESSPIVYTYEETLNPGIYYIRITPDGSNCGRYNIRYKRKILQTSIKITPSKTSVTAGQKLKLSAKISPSNATDKTVSWLSGNGGIASIDAKGNIQTYQAGVVKFTASAQDGSGRSKVYTLIIKPKKMSQPSLSNYNSKQMYVSYYGQSGVSGYQIQYATNSKFKSAKLKKTSSTSITLKKLKKNKTYYARVRAYVKKGSKYYYGSWSKKSKIKVR